MHSESFTKRHLKKFFGLVLHNYQGQVAIFVALVFQIIFILFALMINVGLLIHHKINLQQSTDLAAYYGAMKQAEMLNVISHVNFQIRQAYKLLTWRYRILGTFGLQPTTSRPLPAANDIIQFPLKYLPPSSFQYNPQSETFRCNIDGASISPLEIPYMCMAHYGFKEFSATSKRDETFCGTDCDKYRGGSFQIPNLPTASSGGAGNYDTGIIGSINSAINNANANILRACERTGPVTIAQLAKFYLAYLQDVKNKKLFIKMLMANLSTGETELLDIAGDRVITGVENTFRNNLTEANNTSIKPNATDGTFETYNSLSIARNSACGYNDLNTSPSDSGSATLFAEINFKFIQYFLLKCEIIAGGTKSFSAGTIYANVNGAIDTTRLDTTLKTQIAKELGGQQVADRIEQIMTQNFYDHTVGIEKNPWCGVYYGVKASSTPIIPFLPISKVTLNAVSFAKPFGGSVGPRQYKDWPSSAKKSDATGGDLAQTDLNLPIQNPIPGQLSTLKDNMKIMLNYSNYVGDRVGLAQSKIVSAYFDMLLNKSVATNKNNLLSSNSKTPEPSRGINGTVPQGEIRNWPAYAEWNNISEPLDSTKYDPLAYDTLNNRNSFMRDIELSVVAPNQFETTYYSIEPDFYNVYIKDKLGKPGVMEKLMERAGLGGGTKVYIPKDFGHNDSLAGVGKGFSVRNQMEVVQHIIRAANDSAPPTLTTYSFSGGDSHHAAGINAISDFYFNYVTFLPGSLLTSWTMKDLITDDFSVIPRDQSKSPFAECLDGDLQGGNGYGSIVDTPDPRGGTEKLPPAPGNCITGGRTGYSVKIVSPSALIEETVGSVTDRTLNPPNNFISF